MVQSIDINTQTQMMLNPERLLQQLAESGGTGCLQLTSQGNHWFLYLDQGFLIYATHTIDPGDRFERHLRRLSQRNEVLTREFRAQVRQQWDLAQTPTPICEYESIRWLVNEGILAVEEAGELIRQLILEVLESYLCLREGTHQLVRFLDVPVVAQFTPGILVDECKANIRKWQAWGEKISSPFQRPYFFGHGGQGNLSLEQQQRLGSLLRGFSFRHLAVILNQDEFQLVKSLYPLIGGGVIVVREPQAPFDQLPRFDTCSFEDAAPVDLDDSGDLSTGFPAIANLQRQYTIVCIDDSPTMLNELSRFLSDDAFSVVTLNDSVKALMDVMRIKPDLILLDVGMPNIDGYKFCKVIRNHERFKQTPIIMVTGNTGLIDRAKARLVGATDYMTKPFTQAELLKMVFQYLS
ncbi:response regulator [Candidatus Synechococcus calcipolaris G9]|uniref:Response regulator n=1 Tax=Candidatus Synechococcus calcipolaris G9 TaxID=1497997 RepID=A0ABT6F218_9SYNE|nr:response regulator [Candidatus Synechococcus calcipolaris]MDG2991877.1 response regulator [Candidatus Synechococcus calcipolaris G9]